MDHAIELTEAVILEQADEIARLREELRIALIERDEARALCELAEFTAERFEEHAKQAEQREREALAIIDGIANMTHAKMRDSQHEPMSRAEYDTMFREWAQNIARHLLSRAREQEQSKTGGE